MTTDSDELIWTSGCELVELMRNKTLSPVEVMAAFLERIERLEPMVHAFMTVAAEPALEAARRAEAAIAAGDAVGPLVGLPIAIKDNLWTKDMVTTGGSAVFADFVPTDDCIAVERIRAAGGVIVGKTHLPEFAAWPRTVSVLREECINPWDSNHVSGASSGGSAAAVAAAMVPMAIGTDGGGSTRIPAALCGVVGLQPSTGVVPSWGRVGYVRFSGIGPMTRDVRDAARLLDVIAGPDARDPISAGRTAVEHEAQLQRGIDGARLAWMPTLSNVEPAAAVVAAARAAVSVLEETCVVKEADVRFERLWDMFYVLTIGASAYEGSPPGFQQLPEVQAFAADPERRHLLSPYITAAMDGAAPPSPAQYQDAVGLRDRAAAQLDELFQHFDLIVTPAMPVTAPRRPEDPWALPFESIEEYTSQTSLVNVLGLTAISVPCGFVDGLPVGLQLIGPHGAEAAVLRASRVLEQQRPWTAQHPMLD